MRKNLLTFLFFSTTREKFLFNFLRLHKHGINENIAHTLLHCSETALSSMST